MNIKALYRISFLAILAHYSYGTRNAIGHFSKHHSSEARQPDGALATVSRTTIDGLDLTTRVGNILTGRELKAIIPQLSRNKWFPIKTRKGHEGIERKSSHHRRTKIVSHKSHKHAGGVEKHTREQQFRLEHWKHTMGLSKVQTREPVKNGNNRIGQDHRAVKKASRRVTLGGNNPGKKHHDEIHSIGKSHAFISNRLAVLAKPSRSTLALHANRRHHKEYTGDVVATAGQIKENTIRRLTSGTTNIQNDYRATKQGTDESRTCACKNGGHCILKLVCACPRNYYGVLCQHKLHHKSCGDVRHGTWIMRDCSLCKCENGNMLCMTNDIGSCDDTFDEQEEILQPELVINDRRDSYISTDDEKTATSREITHDFDDQPNRDILTFEYQIIPLPSSAIWIKGNILILIAVIILPSLLLRD